LLSSIIGRYVTKRRDLVTVLSCSKTCVTASVKMIRFGYFYKDEEKERARHEQDGTPIRGAMRQARNHAKPPGPRHNKGKAAFEGFTATTARWWR
jgi:hypothetical protein